MRQASESEVSESIEVAKPMYVAKQRRAQAPWILDLRPATLAFATIILVSVTSLLYVTQASRVAATGYDIQYATDRRVRLEREHQQLLVKAAELQALSRVETEATSKLGMAPAPMPDYLPVGEPPVNVEAALAQAELEAQHLPRSWPAELRATMLRLSRRDAGTTATGRRAATDSPAALSTGGR